MHSERKGCVRRNNQIGSRILTTMSEGRRARVDLGVELHTKSAAFEDDRYLLGYSASTRKLRAVVSEAGVLPDEGLVLRNPRKGVFSVFIGRKHRIEQVKNTAGASHQGQSLCQHLAGNMQSR
jgi:hypothetical protein